MLPAPMVCGGMRARKQFVPATRSIWILTAAPVAVTPVVAVIVFRLNVAVGLTLHSVTVVLDVAFVTSAYTSDMAWVKTSVNVLPDV
jgi:hypothetical protein